MVSGRDAGLRLLTHQDSFACEPSRLYVILSDIGSWPREGEPRILKSREPESVQLSFDDATRALLTISRRDMAGRTNLLVEHELLRTQDQLNEWFDYWQRTISEIRSRVEL